MKETTLSARELRIGNYVYWNIPEKQGVTHIVVSITTGRINTIPISLGENMDCYQPIPLTEEWLLKFGFEKLNREIPAYEQKNLIVEWLFERWTGRLYLDAYNSIQIIEIKYVHQLQNLYFALTGEELELKETK